MDFKNLKKKNVNQKVSRHLQMFVIFEKKTIS